jgi:hypothetical protein
MSHEPRPRLERRTRLGIAALGAVAWLAAMPAGFAGLTALGFHGPMRDHDWDDIVALFALPMLPLLLLLLGLACFLCFTRRGLLIVEALAALFILDSGLLAASSYSMGRPKPLPPGLVTAVAPGPRRMTERVSGPARVAVACSATGAECWTIRTENGREVSRKRLEAPRR